MNNLFSEEEQNAPKEFEKLTVKDILTKTW
jgi:hypothetical protein